MPVFEGGNPVVRKRQATFEAARNHQSKLGRYLAYAVSNRAEKRLNFKFCARTEPIEAQNFRKKQIAKTTTHSARCQFNDGISRRFHQQNDHIAIKMNYASFKVLLRQI